MARVRLAWVACALCCNDKESAVDSVPGFGPEERWCVPFGGDGDDRFYDLAWLDEGRLIAVGDSHPGGGLEDLFVGVIEEDGQRAASVTVAIEGRATAHAVAVDDDGGVLIAGQLDDGAGLDVLVVKLDGDLTERWRRVWDGGGEDLAHDLALDPSTGDVVVVGTTAGSDGAGCDRLLLRLDAETGAVQEVETRGEADDDAWWAVDVTEDGVVYAVGTTDGEQALSCADMGRDDLIVGRWEGSGYREVTHDTLEPDLPYDLTFDAQGQVVVAGHTYGFQLLGDPQGGADAFLATFDPDDLSLVGSYQGGTDQDELGVRVVWWDGSLQVIGHGTGGEGPDQPIAVRLEAPASEVLPLESAVTDTWRVWGATTGSTGALYTAGWTRQDLAGEGSVAQPDAFICGYPAPDG